MTSADRQSRLTPARKLAYDVLRDVDQRDGYAHEILSAQAVQSQLSEEDLAFARKLVLGVVATSGVLDECIENVLRKRTAIDGDVRMALRIAVYEMLFLGKAGHAAVSQGVELVKQIRPKAAGFANYVLRRVNEKAAEFPFGGPHVDIAACARLYGFPQWMCEELTSQLGPEGATSFLRVSNEPAPLTFAYNALSANSQWLEQVQASIGLVEVDAPLPAYTLASRDDFGLTLFQTGLEQGSCFMADEASIYVAAFVLGKRIPASILEVGAGRATKTLLLQNICWEQSGKQTDIITIDNKEFKTAIARTRAKDMGVALVDAITADATKPIPELGERQFDTVFVDAPCTGTGTLRRHPEIRWKLSKASVDELAILQLRLLENTARYVKSGGELVYATCSVLQQENESVVEAFLRSPAGQEFTLQSNDDMRRTTLTSNGSDAHFCCRLTRNSAQ